MNHDEVFDHLHRRRADQSASLSLETMKRDLALEVFDIGAFKDKAQSEGGKGFKLKLHEKHPDDPLSPFFLNLRTPDNPKPGPLTQVIVTHIGEIFFALAKIYGIEYDAAAGIPNAGSPFAEALVATALKADWVVPVIKLGKTEIDEKRKIEGVLPGDWVVGMRVLLLDDLITQADSKLEALAVLNAVGFSVTGALVLVDRDQGGTQEVRKQCPLYPVFTISDLLMIYKAEGRISEAMADEIYAYVLENKRRTPEEPKRWP